MPKYLIALPALITTYLELASLLRGAVEYKKGVKENLRVSWRDRKSVPNKTVHLTHCWQSNPKQWGDVGNTGISGCSSHLLVGYAVFETALDTPPVPSRTHSVPFHWKPVEGWLEASSRYSLAGIFFPLNDN